MGDRGQVKILMGGDTAPVFLYAHWGGEDLWRDVQTALKLKERWEDEEYLARIIFQGMLAGDDGTTGYGISTTMHGDIEHPIPEIDCDKQIIKVLTRDGKETGLQYTMEEFVKLTKEQIEKIG